MRVLKSGFYNSVAASRGKSADYACYNREAGSRHTV